jgi:putative toxin-antitoxin system antitoxin component (TIGR02293 family)
MTNINKRTSPFNTKRSIKKAAGRRSITRSWNIKSGEKTITWSNTMERVMISRQGIPYTSIEILSNRLDRPVKNMLVLLGIPQTTYNKKKNEDSLLDSRDSELLLMITELLDYGLDVFNDEKEKFQRWLKKPNLSLGGNSPESLLDTTTGIDEVNYALNKIEFGNFA